MSLNSAARSSLYKKSRTSNAVKSSTRDAAAKALVAQRARQEANRQAAEKLASKQAAEKETAKQVKVTARRDAAKRETARKLKQIADLNKSASSHAKQNRLKDKLQHAKRVADGRAIPTRVKQVVNYGAGRNTAPYPKVHQIRVINSRFQQLQSTSMGHTNKVVPAQNPRSSTIQPKKVIDQGKAVSATKTKIIPATKPLTTKEKVANLMTKQKEPPKLTTKEKVKNIFKRYEQSNLKAETKELKKIERKAELKKMFASWKTTETAVKKSVIQKAASQKISSTKEVRSTRKKTTTKSTISTKIATQSSAQVKSSVDAHKEKVSKSKAKDKQVADKRKAASEKDSQRNKKPTKRVTRSAKITEKQAQSKIGGTTTAILHSFQNTTKTGNKGPVTRRSSQRIAQQSGAHGDDGGYSSDAGGSRSDSDDERDTSLHPESKQSKDSESRFEWGKNKTEFQYQFRNVNSKFPPSKDAIKELNSPGMKSMVADIGYTDCSEIAEELYKATGKKGTIITIEPKVGRDVFIGQKQGKTLISEVYEYHTVYRDNHYVYDPRLSKNPIPRGDFQNIISKLNPNGVKVYEGDPWSPVKVHKRGNVANKVGKI
tara:strand:- start:1963 stop:3765 length:1803 start_codon:yes stop_codon:yes gene_type:complete